MGLKLGEVVKEFDNCIIINFNELSIMAVKNKEVIATNEAEVILMAHKRFVRKLRDGVEGRDNDEKKE